MKWNFIEVERMRNQKNNWSRVHTCIHDKSRKWWIISDVILEIIVAHSHTKNTIKAVESSRKKKVTISRNSELRSEFQRRKRWAPEEMAERRRRTSRWYWETTWVVSQRNRTLISPPPRSSLSYLRGLTRFLWRISICHVILTCDLAWGSLLLLVLLKLTLPAR